MQESGISWYGVRIGALDAGRQFSVIAPYIGSPDAYCVYKRILQMNDAVPAGKRKNGRMITWQGREVLHIDAGTEPFTLIDAGIDIAGIRGR